MSDGPPVDESVDEIVQEFLAESTEGLDQFDRDIVALEADPRSSEHLGSAFRIFHTIKGTSGFLGFPVLEELTHGAESMLSKVRDGELALNAARTDVLLDVGDTIRYMLAVIEQTGHDGGRDITDLVRRLELLQGDTGGDHHAGSASSKPSPSPVRGGTKGGGGGSMGGTSMSGGGGGSMGGTSMSGGGGGSMGGTSMSGGGGGGAATLAPPPDAHGRGARAAFDTPAPGTATGTATGTKQDSGLTTARQVVERSVRLDVELLDSLMRQVGELVLVRNEVISFTDSLGDTVLHQAVQRLSGIVSELQEGVMKTRMQPLASVFSKLPRIVRDLAAQLGKEITIQVTGSETELDRSVLEAIRDPFTHLIRNAIDHGIEFPEEREIVGKSRSGTIQVHAAHEGGQVVMEVVDDGRGIDPARVGAKAVQMGLLPQERLDIMSSRDIIDLIFNPGFSTAESVTSVSGRGVGMDVVRANIESIGGSVDVVSQMGRGTTFKIKIPLTLAIVPALLVECRDQRFAIPQPNLIEMLHVGTQTSSATVERIGQATVIRLRGKLLPLVHLDEVFGFPSIEQPAQPGATVAVLQADDVKFGLVFDEVYETQEIVVKPLDALVNRAELFAGATVLGDGSVALIIDVLGLAQLAGLREASERIAALPMAEEESEEERDKTAFAVLRVGENRTIAIPVAQVARLESIPPPTVEKSGEVDVVQYRGSLMRLVRLHEVLGILGHEIAPDEPLKVIVHESDHGPIGFVVAELVDVLEDVVDLVDVDSGYGLAGAVVLHGRVTDVLDLEVAMAWMHGEGMLDAQ